MRATEDQWQAAIAAGDRRRTRALYEGFGTVLLDEMSAEGGRPVLSLPGTNRVLRQWISELSGDVAVDVGCGPTPVAAGALVEAGFGVVAVDLSEIILRIAAGDCDQAAFALADAEALPIATGSADVITCDDTLEHVFDQEAMVSELARVLRPGGRLLLVTPNASGYHVQLARVRAGLKGERHPRAHYHITPGHTRELRWREIQRLLSGSFRLRRCVAFGPARTRRDRLLTLALRAPGMVRFSYVHFMELERR